MSDAENPMDLIGQLISKVQAENSDASTIVGVAGGGAVSIELQGYERVVSVTIDPEALADAGTLEDLVAAAFNHALEQARAAQIARAGKILGGLNLGGPA